ncbi:MAG: excinuclease ABC subunit UvrA [Chloroflexi bacterium]|nr:excinuclease ABC subunit UvrA [Chloroflexota bacterium]
MSNSCAQPAIRLRGVRHNNLKNFDLDLPLGRLIVITGLSGSGKSSLAFDTLYAEGQRRYIETFSPYARQFFDRMDKPQVDSIQGIPPAIAIEQRNAVKTTRSTVGTMTEICDYMRLLWPRVARLHCRQCGKVVQKDTPQGIWREMSLAAGPGPQQHQVALITFELPLSDKLSLSESLALIAKQGYHRLWLPEHAVQESTAADSSQRQHAAGVPAFPGRDPAAGAQFRILRIDEALAYFSKAPPKTLMVVQDRVVLEESQRARFVEACEQAYHFGKGKLAVYAPDSAQAWRFSNRLHCAVCDLEYREPSAALFSFNHPVGACPVCRGFGRIIGIDYNLAIPDRTRTLAQGAVKPWQTGQGAECQEDLLRFCKLRQAPVDIPFQELPQKWQDWVVEGDPDYGKDASHEWPHAWYGVKGYFRWLESKAYKMHVRVLLSRYRVYSPCPACQGRRFQPEALLFKVKNGAARSLTLADFYQFTVQEALQFIERLASAQKKAKASDPLQLALLEVRSRLAYLEEVGLGYLTLDRPTRTLSGGETERVNLTTCLGSRLVNTLFVLDEPSVGLHPRDTQRLVRILERLRDTGNTIVVVEHEAGVMRAADHLVDLGPGHGETGGRVVFQGAYAELLCSTPSITGEFLSGRRQIVVPARRPVDLSGGEPKLVIAQATRHNLKNLTVEIPLRRFVCVTGVSGSGKTTLVREVLFPALEGRLKEAQADARRPGPGQQTEAAPAETRPSEAEEADTESEDGNGDNEESGLGPPPSAMEGWEHLGRVMLVDQSPLGKTPRSNPAVYIGAFQDIRELFAQTELARQRGLSASAFSFNSAQGQCERCRGAGFEKIEMQFLSDVYIRCPDCNGRRYRSHILEVTLSPWPASAGAGVSSSPVEAKKVELRAKINAVTGAPGWRLPEQSTGLSGARQQAPTGRSRGRPARSAWEWSIADLLEATVEEVIDFLSGFDSSRAAARAKESLQLLQEVGLGYLRLGQPINTLSGGESQRLKLVGHLAECGQGKAVSDKPVLFLFDEPTTGLHFDDVRMLLQVFQRLVEAGHSVLVIEHNLELIKCADWLIDLGPEAGAEGGRIVAQGTPEQVRACPESHTGQALANMGARD